MKTLRKPLLWITMFSLVLVISCKDTDPVASDLSFDVLSDHLVANNLDLDDILTNWIVAAPAEADLDAFLAGYKVYDVRAATDFVNGHITVAENTSLGTIVEDAVSVTKPILVACYTGQTAAMSVVALRLSGHPDAKVLKFGMSGWTSDLAGPWEGKTSSQAVGNVNWTTDATASLSDYAHPSWTSTSTDPAKILAERVKIMTSGGFKGIDAVDVLAHPEDYFINNFWDQADVDLYGHIGTAARIKPLTLATDEFKHYPTDANITVVTYCWTGQTSAMVTAYLNVMGYNAVSLKFGVNNMIYSELQSHKYQTPTVNLPVSL